MTHTAKVTISETICWDIEVELTDDELEEYFNGDLTLWEFGEVVNRRWEDSVTTAGDMDVVFVHDGKLVDETVYLNLMDQENQQ